MLAHRAREMGQQQLTYERGKQRYTGKVKVVLDTLREHGIEFIQYADKRPVRLLTTCSETCRLVVRILRRFFSAVGRRL